MDTSTLFSALGESAAPYSTDTAPQEQAASGTGNDQGPSQAIPPAAPTQASPGAAPVPPPPQPHSAPMSNIMAAIMRGAAKVQGQEQVKQIASKQLANADKRQITIKPNPDDPGNPRITLKDFTADAINQTEGSDLQEAHDRPARQVEAKIAASQPQQPVPAAAAPAVQAPTTPPPPNHPLEQAAQMVDANLGYRVPRPWDTDIAEKIKSEDGLRQIAEEMGDPDPEATAHQAWRQLQHGKVSAQAVQQRVANFRLQKLESESNRIESTMAPAERAAARQQAEIDRQTNQQRLLRNQSDAELKAGNDEKLGWLRATDLSTIDPDKLEATAQASTNAPWTASDLNRAHLKQQQDVNKAFLDFTHTKKDTYKHGYIDSWQDAKTAFNHPLTDQQDKMGAAAWKAAHNYVKIQTDRAAEKRQHEDDQHEMTMLRIQNASKEKPTPLGRADINLMAASELTSIDPSTVKNYDGALEAKEGLLKKQIADRTDEYNKAQNEVKAILNDPNAKNNFRDPVALAGFKSDQQAAHARVVAATTELQQIQAARATRKAGGTVQPVTAPAPPPVKAPAVAPPNVPHRPVANGRYTPEVEAGIAKAMSDHHVGRQRVIQQLKASGYLQ